jgi:hypothetical protein
MSLIAAQASKAVNSAATTHLATSRNGIGPGGRIRSPRGQLLRDLQVL